MVPCEVMVATDVGGTVGTDWPDAASGGPRRPIAPRRPTPHCFATEQWWVGLDDGRGSRQCSTGPVTV